MPGMSSDVAVNHSGLHKAARNELRFCPAISVGSVQPAVRFEWGANREYTLMKVVIKKRGEKKDFIAAFND